MPAEGYLFGAICPARGTGSGLMLPAANTDAMNLHLAEISNTVTPRSHAELVLDDASRHQGGNMLSDRVFVGTRSWTQFRS